MFSCALIGADGAGKSTVCERVPAAFPLPIKSIYLGVNADSSRHALPTTRLVRATKRLLGAPPDTAGPRDPATLGNRGSGGRVRRSLRSVKSGLGLANRILDECYRQLLAGHFVRSGSVVLFDRHYLADYYAYDVAPGSENRAFGRRIHGYFLNRIYPRPDLVIFLDAAPEVLFARKGEGTLDLLARRRADYLELRNVFPDFAIVDAAQPLDQVVSDVVDRLLAFHENRSDSGVATPC